jgi:hypothetical protein
MKEVIMKKILFWMVLILGTMALLGSCAKKDETTAAAAIPAEGTGTTASGTITDLTLTGTYNTSHLGEEPSGGCVDNSTSISNHGYPSETKSHTKKFIVTGTSTYTVSQVGYSDAACSTMTSYWNTMYTDFTVGSALSSLTAGTPAKPTTGAKISRVASKYALMANTTATLASYQNSIGSLGTLVSGIEFKLDEPDLTTQYGIVATATVSGSSYLYIYDGNTADNVNDWPTNGTDIWWK